LFLFNSGASFALVCKRTLQHVLMFLVASTFSGHLCSILAIRMTPLLLPSLNVSLPAQGIG
jgi:hypothetical protein